MLFLLLFLLTQSPATTVERRLLEIEDARAEDVSALLTALKSADPRIQRLAARTAGRLERPALADAVVPLLRAPDALVRAEAANAMGQMRAAYAYAALLREEKDGRVRAVLYETIGRVAPVPGETERVLVDGLTDPDLTARIGAARGLESLSHGGIGLPRASMDGKQGSETDAAALPTEAATTHTAAEHTPSHDLPTSFPETWGDLRLIAEIGRGGFGRVFRAYDPDLKREVALKVIKLRDSTHRAAVLKEGQMLASVRHNNVVTVYRAQQIGDEIGLTMELIRGRHLGDLVKQEGPMGAEEAAVIGVSLCQALAAAHGQGLLHRDVKSRNVMRESGGRIVLMDFGAGREVHQIERVKRADLSGTPLYLAPELFAGQPASPASDLYSLGVLLFYLVTQKYPVEGTTLADLVLAHSSRQRKLLFDTRTDLPAAFVQAVEHALAARPEQRYRTAGEMMAELRATLPIPEVFTPSPVVTPIPQRPSTLLRALIAVPLVILAIGLFGMLTSAQYNLSLGRDAGFSDDTVLDWWVVGVRSLIPVLVYVGGLLLVVKGIGAFWTLCSGWRRQSVARQTWHGRACPAACDAGEDRIDRRWRRW